MLDIEAQSTDIARMNKYRMKTVKIGGEKNLSMAGPVRDRVEEAFDDAVAWIKRHGEDAKGARVVICRIVHVGQGIFEPTITHLKVERILRAFAEGEIVKPGLPPDRKVVKCPHCSGDGKMMSSTGDPKHPLQATRCRTCDGKREITIIEEK